ncbi:MAG: hypothetical protein IJ274_08595, partial [Lachnospiraceae bacterium]|nr:hypothetical protein [Lachnospiraceae bacterium]
MGICVFLFYEMAVRSLITGYCSFSFHFYSGYGDRDWYVPFLSPFYMIDKYWNEELGLAATAAGLLGFAAAVLALAYWCYKKRPSELAGSAMTFHAIKPVIKIGISVPVAIVAGMATAGLMEYSPLDDSGSPFFPILLGALFVILSNALIQVIFEADIRGMLHKKRDILVTAILTLVIMFVFRYDMIGFDSYIPKLEKIESAMMVTDTNQRYSRVYYDENMKQLNKEEYLDKYMYLTGEDVANVRDLALYSIEQYQKYPNRRAFIDAEQEHSDVIYKFRLKNGQTVVRAIPVLLRDETARNIINKIESSEAFVRVNEPAMSEYLSTAVESGEYKIDAYWGGDMNRQDMTAAQAKEFLKLYQKDLLNDSYAVKNQELPIGQVDLYLDMQISYGRRIAMPVYASYVNSVAFLNENGFSTDEFVAMEDIDRIQISKYYDAEENVLTESIAGFEETVVVEMEGETFTADYVNATEIEDIINRAYPISLEWEYWYHESPFDEGEHRITVYFREGTEAFEEYGSVADFYFLKDQVPDYVLEDLPRDTVPEA